MPPLDVSCTTEEQVPITADPRATSGNPAPIDGALVVTVQSGDGTVSQDAAAPLVFKAVSGAVAGTTVYLVEADADLGGDVRHISDIVTLTVTSAEAATLGFVAGPAELKPVA